MYFSIYIRDGECPVSVPIAVSLQEMSIVIQNWNFDWVDLLCLSDLIIELVMLLFALSMVLALIPLAMTPETIYLLWFAY